MARLGKKRKIPGEASGLWLPHWNVTNNTDITEGPVKSPLSYQARRELVEHMAPVYREASRAQKMLLLDTFVALTGSVRKYALWLLNHPVESALRTPHVRPVHYGPEVQQALYLVWRAANQICAKRLIPFLPTLIEALERHGHLHLTEKCRSQLLSMSAATADRLLRSQRKHDPRGLSTTQAGTLLKHQIPIRTFQDWNATQPGLTSGRSGRPLWHPSGGRLRVHVDPHRHRNGMDRMPSPPLPQPGDGAGGLPTRTHALPLSDPGD